MTALLSAWPNPAASAASSSARWTSESGVDAPAARASARISRTSFRCCESRASGVKSPAIIFGPLASMIRE